MNMGNFFIILLLPTLIAICALFMEICKESWWRYFWLTVLVISTLLLGAGNYYANEENQSMAIRNKEVSDSTISELNAKFKDCELAREGIDSLKKKPYTQNINTSTTVNNTNEYELTNKELLSLYDSVLKYSKSKCYEFYVTSNSNGGKAQQQIKVFLNKKGYEYTGGGPWHRDTESSLSYFESESCVGIIVDRF